MVPTHTDREPQPPYDRELPKEYWQGLKQPDQYAQYRARHPIGPATKPINGWIVCLVAALAVAALVSHQRPSPGVMPSIAAATPTPIQVGTPIPSPAPAQKAPRAEPVAGPLTTEGQPMLSGRQYSVAMPDGRHLLVNYRGLVDHACNLPRQHGVNNAAYTETATGHTWIWTVPAGTSNVPQWIDP